MNFETSKRTLALGALAISMMLFSGCQSAPVMDTVDHVELDRFMGDWYVIASIPTFLEKDIYNAVESYERGNNNRIDTTFTFRKGGFDGEQKTYTPTGFVGDDPSNAVWGMQFLWPIKADYRIVYLNEDYTQTVIGRNKRDYVWIMARTPQIASRDYTDLIRLVDELGYDITKIREVPQRWD